MTGIDLFRHLIETGQRNSNNSRYLPAYPNDVDRARALTDCTICYLRSRSMRKILRRCIHACSPFLVSGPKRIHKLVLTDRQREPKTPRLGGSFGSAPQSAPMRQLMMDRQIDNPIPTPPDLVV